MTEDGRLYEINGRLCHLEARAEAADKSRAVTHQKQDTIIDQINDLKVLIAPFIMKVEVMEPEVKKFTRLHQNAVGAFAVLAAVFTAVGGVIMWLINKWVSSPGSGGH